MSAPPSGRRAKRACTARRLSIRPAGEKERQRKGLTLHSGAGTPRTSGSGGVGRIPDRGLRGGGRGTRRPHAGPEASVLCAGARVTWLLTQTLGRCLTHWTPAAPPPWPPRAQPGPSRAASTGPAPRRTGPTGNQKAWQQHLSFPSLLLPSWVFP